MPVSRILVALLALASCLAGCASARTQHLRRESLSRVPVEVVREIENRLDTVGPALVRITTWMGIKTGVLVRADGLILTCAHASWTRGTVETIRFADGRIGRARVLGDARESDLLALQVIEPDGPFPVVALADEVRAGEWAFVASMVRGGTSVGLSAGEVRMVDAAGAFGPEHLYRNPVLLIDAPAVHGESGAPVLNAAGRIIGIASMAGITETAVALVAGSVNEIHRVLPRLVRGDSIPAEADTGRQVEAFLLSLRKNPGAVWPEPGRPDEAFVAVYERCWQAVAGRLRERWREARELTSEMTAEGLREIADEVDRQWPVAGGSGR